MSGLLPPRSSSSESGSPVNEFDESKGKDSNEQRKQARREYHKCIERKRRDRMRVLYEELRQLTEHSEPADKNVVLLDAIKLIQNLRNETEQLERQVFEKRKKARTGMAPPSTTSTTSPMTPTSLAQPGPFPFMPHLLVQ
mmetsp:Transcript_2851/g.4639  ORF Transcript_2851/g.4639 Transcript_2851/m.4639 type:complete len:140 (+) Transcript_2851:153-572(+)